jgi:hypothetical protein
MVLIVPRTLARLRDGFFTDLFFGLLNGLFVGLWRYRALRLAVQGTPSGGTGAESSWANDPEGAGGGGSDSSVVVVALS